MSQLCGAVPARRLAGRAWIVALLLVAGGGLALFLLRGAAPPALARARRAVAEGTPGEQKEALAALAEALASGAFAEAAAEDRAAAEALLREAIVHPEDEVAATAMRLAAQRRDRAALPALLKMAGAPGSRVHPDLQIRALEAIAAIGREQLPRDRELTADLIALLERRDTPEACRHRVVQALAAVWGPGAAQALLDLAEETAAPASLRAAAVRGLGEHVTMESPFMPRLLALYGAEAEPVAAAARQALDRARGRESVLALYGLRGAAGQALKSVGGIQAANAERNRQIRELLDEGADRDDDRPSSPLAAMTEALQSRDAERRLAAAYDLGQLGREEAVPALIRALGDPEAAVRRVAAQSLQRLTGQSFGVHPAAWQRWLETRQTAGGGDG
jgi:HEAT repeat protein